MKGDMHHKPEYLPLQSHSAPVSLLTQSSEKIQQPMSYAQQAVAIIADVIPVADLEWINSNRSSTDWKTRIYRHRPTGRQFAIYNRKTSIVALFEMPITGVANVDHLPIRPKSDSLKIKESNFAAAPGACYETKSLEGFAAMLGKYIGI